MTLNDIPILRHGRPYRSLDVVTLVHHATDEPVVRLSQANSGMIVRDVRRMDDAVLERFSVAELLAMCRKAGELFLSAALPVGEHEQTFDDYIRSLSATTGMPVTYCRNNAAKIHRVLSEMNVILRGLTRGLDLEILDRGWGRQDGQTVSFFREGRIFGAVLPSNSPGVHGLWVPAVALKAPIVLKPGREEPWTPLRIIEALAAAGLPREAFGFYPTDHAGASELLRYTQRSMLFGDSATTTPWRGDPRIEIHGPGYSKVLLGDDAAGQWERYLDVMVESITANGGRSCINASGVWTPRNGRAIAEALAQRLAKITALPAEHPDATIAAFANAAVAERMSAVIDSELGAAGAMDLTEQYRGESRLAAVDQVRYLLPTVIGCESPAHALANREFLFPYASVVECPADRMAEAIGPTLVATVITEDRKLIEALMASPNVARLNVGPIPTVRIAWDQPHEGNLFEHLYRRRAFQIEHAA